jgi:HEAT repeat protein
MRSIHIVWTRLARRLGVAVLLAMLVGAGISRADRFPPDPVEELRQALRSGLNRNLAERVQALRSLADMRRALGLQEWNSEAGGTNEQIHILLADRFKKEAQRLLKYGTPNVRSAVIDMLAEMGPSLMDSKDPKGIARALAPDLADLVKNDDTPAIREQAARALGLIFPDPSVAVPPLLDLLSSPNLADRRAAANALLNLLRVANQLSSRSKGSGAGVVADLADIVQLGTAILPRAGIGLTNPDPEVRRLAAEAIEQLAAALDNQVQLQQSGDAALEETEEGKARASARSQLVPLMDAFRQQEVVLAKALHDTDVQVRLLTQRALEHLGNARLRLHRNEPPSAAPAGAPGPGATEGPARTGVELAAGTNQAQVGSSPDPLLQTLRTAVPVLVADIADPDVRVRLGAIDVLETLGDAAAPAVPALVRALGDPNRFVRWAAARTLGKMSPIESATTVPNLAHLLFDDDLDVRLSAAAALDRFGPAAEAAVPDLIQAMKASDADMREAAIKTVGGIGTGAQSAVPALAAALFDPDPRIRQIAADVLGRFGSLAASAEPALRKALDDSEPDVRKAASDALLSIVQASSGK